MASPGLLVVDCTTHLVRGPGASLVPRSGREDALRGHIPGAIHLDLTSALRAADSPLWFACPQPDDFARQAAAAGLDPGSHIVCYSSANYTWAARAWWLLRAHGWPRVSVLDGGLKAWSEAGCPVETGPPRVPARLAPAPAARPAVARASADDVLAVLDAGGTMLVNALAADQFDGTSDLHYGRKGRIPGSRNVPALRLVKGPAQRMLGADALRAVFDEAGVDLEIPVVAYCGAGIAASGVCLALAVLGARDVRMYDPGMQEWAADPRLPIELPPAGRMGDDGGTAR